MTIAGGPIAGTQSAAGDAAAWAAVRADASIQFAPVPSPPKPETPEWLLALGRFIERLFRPFGELFGLDWTWLKWVLVGLAIAGALWLVWATLLAPWLARRRGSAPAAADWQPERAAALALLEDADRLAAEGRYGDAAHLLLLRSVGEIEAARPRAIDPSTTAREIGGMAAVPERARGAFAEIARVVERSLFALRGAGLDDWQRARAAYADFALADWRERSA